MNSEQKQKLIAGLMTSVILLLVFLLMSISTVPSWDLITERYEEIDWMRFNPESLRPERIEQSPEKSQPAKKELQPEVIKHIDLTELQNQLSLSELNLSSKSLSDPGKIKRPQTAARIQLDNMDVGGLEGDFNLAIDQSSPLTPMHYRGKGKNKPGNRLKASSGDSPVPGNDQFGNQTGLNLKGPEKRGKKSGQVKQVDLKQFSEFDEGLQSFSSIYKPLIAWMKLHPAELRPVTKRFMNYKPLDLTSRAKFSVSGRSFEMMLLCVESTYEVGIVLLEKREVTYLIDQGFHEQSNFLRVGKVDRLANQDILKFNTKLKPAGSRRTQEFYQIFLTWWETVKHEVE